MKFTAVFLALIPLVYAFPAAEYRNTGRTFTSYPFVEKQQTGRTFTSDPYIEKQIVQGRTFTSYPWVKEPNVAPSVTSGSIVSALPVIPANVQGTV